MDAVAVVDGVDLGPAGGGGAAEFDVGGDEGGERGRLGEVGDEGGAARGDLEGFEAGKGERRDELTHGGGDELEVGLPVGGGEGFGGGGEGFGRGREGDPLGAVEALELDVGPVGDAVEDAAVGPGEGEGDGAERDAACDGGGAGGGAGERGDHGADITRRGGTILVPWIKMCRDSLCLPHRPALSFPVRPSPA